ncbi:uncharacterized protein N7503_011965 [Penicillium pulvis]|uniref:uncharacterized protein n=1 Tax=Penicillium pulvis TaxID=1562058 RepID=UPI002548F8C9|nr:uncharacterized protein N7503_011965 [Penicillium pulvis]KAJ5786753.1 hypothetical protein N7503_011965 [Penicillium pulvis]
MASSFSLHVKIYIDPSNVEKFLEHFKPVYDAVVKEPECRFFELHQDPANPGTLTWVENWHVLSSSFQGNHANNISRNTTTQWFMENQMTKAYYEPYLAATEPMFVKPREFKIYNRLAPDYCMAKDQY